MGFKGLALLFVQFAESDLGNVGQFIFAVPFGFSEEGAAQVGHHVIFAPVGGLNRFRMGIGFYVGKKAVLADND